LQRTARCRYDSVRASFRLRPVSALQYVSTRQTDHTASLSFEAILLGGRAPDGGLYVPAAIPAASSALIQRWQDFDYAEIVGAVLERFAGDALSRHELDSITAMAYRDFTHPAVAPLKQIGRDEWLLELFHGPTLGLRDYALQVLGRMLDTVLTRAGRRATILATGSGETAAAAIAACRDRKALDVVGLFPEGQFPAIARRLITTVDAPNIAAVAIDGSLADCRGLVEGLLADPEERARLSLAVVDGSNCGGIAAEIALFIASATALGAPDRSAVFAMPGTFPRTVYAGSVAAAMGLPIDHLVVGRRSEDALGHDRATAEPDLVRTASVDDDGIEATIWDIYRETGEVLAPSAAIALAAMRAVGGESGVPRVALATAHPAQFPDLVERITGRRPRLPPHLEDLMDRPERITRLPNDPAMLRALLVERGQRP
jgi:threonine synthase